MLSARDIINAKLHSLDLPPVSYRISADYGKVEVATSKTSGSDDLFGPTMSIIASINSIANPNGMVIGEDLFRIIKSLSLNSEYHFVESHGHSLGFKYSYPLYALHMNREKQELTSNTIIKLFDRISSRNNLFSHSQSLDLYENRGSKWPKYNQGNSNDKRNRLKNILLVDDNEDTLLTYKSILDAESYHVEAFTDAYKALEHFARLDLSYYDLCILDIRMPYMNGLQMYQRLKSISADLKILFVSALDAADELVSLLGRVTSQDVMKKPVSREQFLNIVKANV